VGSQTLTDGPLEPLLHAIFDGFDAAAIRYLVLRNYDGLPAVRRAGGDVDLLICPNHIDRAADLVRDIAAAQKLWVYQDFTGAGWRQMRIGAVNTDEQSAFLLQLDLKCGEQWLGLPTFDVNGVLDRRRPHELFYIPHPLDEALLAWFGALLHNGRGKGSVSAELVRAVKEHTVLATDILSDTFGATAGRELVDAFVRGDVAASETQVTALRRRLGERTLTGSATRRRAFASNISRALSWRLDANRYGLTIALVGPDGCGKSTIASHLMPLLEAAFLTAPPRRLHLRPGLLPPLAKLLRPWRWGEGGTSAAVTDPHAKAPSGPLGSVARLLYYTGDYVAGHLLDVGPFARWRRSVVVYERYFYDLVVDPKRLRMAPPPGWTKALMNVVPSPDLLIALQAPASEIHERKPELSLDEIQRQLVAYSRIASAHENGHCVDTTGRPGDAALQVFELALETCARRQVDNP
jgi:thymidylate kinase